MQIPHPPRVIISQRLSRSCPVPAQVLQPLLYLERRHLHSAMRGCPARGTQWSIETKTTKKLTKRPPFSRFALRSSRINESQATRSSRPAVSNGGEKQPAESGVDLAYMPSFPLPMYLRVLNFNKLSFDLQQLLVLPLLHQAR